MKKQTIFLAMAAILAVAGCKKKEKDISELETLTSLEQISEYKEPTAADTMMFYFGQMQASNYWQDAETDTLLRSKESREEFMKGFRAAMHMDEDNQAYNKGLQLGLRLSIRLREFEQRYGQEFTQEILAASLQNFLQNDNREGITDAQLGFYEIKDRLELAAAHRDVDAAKGNLAKMGKERGFTMLSDTLYAIDVTPAGAGPRFRDGDRVAVDVSAYTLDGKEIVGRQFPDSITIGEGRVPRIVCLGLHTMTPGQTRTFMTTPRTLFGKRYALYGLPHEDPVLFTVTVTGK